MYGIADLALSVSADFEKEVGLEYCVINVLGKVCEG